MNQEHIDMIKYGWDEKEQETKHIKESEPLTVWVIMAGEDIYPLGSGGKNACYLHKCRAEAMMKILLEHDSEYFDGRGLASLKSVVADEKMLNRLDLSVIKIKAEETAKDSETIGEKHV